VAHADADEATLKEFFDQMDTNKDGKLDKAEIIEFYFKASTRSQ